MMKDSPQLICLLLPRPSPRETVLRATLPPCSLSPGLRNTSPLYHYASYFQPPRYLTLIIQSLADFEEWRKGLRLHELPELEHLDLLNWKTWQTERSETELQRIVMNGPQNELTRSSNAQPAITITSHALLRVLEKDYGIPLSSRASFFAGHSSGEYSAAIASRSISFKEGVKLTRLHGLLTSRTLQLSSLRSYTEHHATDEERAQMTALLMHPDSTVDDVQRVLDEVQAKFKGAQKKNLGLVEIASYNSSLQLVLSGSRAGVLHACDRLREKDIASRAADLPVL